MIINTRGNIISGLGISSFTPDRPDCFTANGNPVYGTVEFEAGSYEKLDGTTINYENIILTSVLVSISLTKNIVKTATEGREGLIHEYTSSGDYIISINGVINGHPNSYPENEVNALKDILNVPDKLSIVNKAMNLFNIDYIVITNFTLPQETGKYSQQGFSISAISDKEIDLVNV